MQEFAGLPLEDKRWLLLFADEARRARLKFPSNGKDFMHASVGVFDKAMELSDTAAKVKKKTARYYDMHRLAIQVAALALRFCVEDAPELPYPSPPSKNRVQTPTPQ